jgi:hypothetical protein
MSDSGRRGVMSDLTRATFQVMLTLGAGVGVLSLLGWLGMAG